MSIYIDIHAYVYQMNMFYFGLLKFFFSFGALDYEGKKKKKQNKNK